VSYERLAATGAFQRGVERILDTTAKGIRLALMCAEKEPLECHRTILVARRLAALGIEVRHIHADGRLESHDDAIARLVRMLRLPESDLFRSRDDIVAAAYRLQAERIAYAPRAK
jgi:uncharacterized protein (DUF488 family)